VGAISGTYQLAGQKADRGTFSLTLADVELHASGFLSFTADTAVLEAQATDTSFEVRIGATGAGATLGGATIGDPALGVTAPAATVSDATFGIASRKTAADADPKVALEITGDVALTGIPGISLTGADWVGTLNELGDLSAAPITVETGGDDVVLDFATTVASLSGSATFQLASFDEITGTFSLSREEGDKLKLTVDTEALRRPRRSPARSPSARRAPRSAATSAARPAR
jgi:hypothetical protein